MQNKPNFRKAEMNVSSILTKDYENVPLRRRRENKPNSNPIKANKTQNKPNFKPIQTQYKPNQSQSNPKQSQNEPKTKPKRTQNKPNQTRSEAEIPTGELLGILKPGTNFKGKKMPKHGISHYFKQFEKKLVTERRSRDYLENREKDKRSKSFSFSLDMVKYGPNSN